MRDSNNEKGQYLTYYTNVFEQLNDKNDKINVY